MASVASQCCSGGSYLHLLRLDFQVDQNTQSIFMNLLGICGIQTLARAFYHQAISQPFLGYLFPSAASVVTSLSSLLHLSSYYTQVPQDSIS